MIYIIYVMGSCRSFRLGSAPERSPTFGENNSQAADMITFKCPGIAIIKNHPTSCFWVAALCNQKKSQINRIHLKFLKLLISPHLDAPVCQGDLLFLYVLHITNVVFSWLPGSGLWCLSIDGALYHC